MKKIMAEKSGKTGKDRHVKGGRRFYMKIQMSKEADYGNWVPEALMKMLWGTICGLGVLTVLLFLLVKTKIPADVLTIVTIAALGMTLYMQRCIIISTG